MAMTDVKAVDIQTASRVANKVSEYGHQARMASENIDAKTAQTNGNVAAHARGYYQRMLSIAMVPGIATRFAESVNTQHALHVDRELIYIHISMYTYHNI